MDPSDHPSQPTTTTRRDSGATRPLTHHRQDGFELGQRSYSHGQSRPSQIHVLPGDEDGQRVFRNRQVALDRNTSREVPPRPAFRPGGFIGRIQEEDLSRQARREGQGQGQGPGTGLVADSAPTLDSLVSQVSALTKLVTDSNAKYERLSENLASLQRDRTSLGQESAALRSSIDPEPEPLGTTPATWTHPVGSEPPSVPTVPSQRSAAEGGRPRHPKTEEYPQFEGGVESDHRAFIDRVDLMRDLQNIPDYEVIGKLPKILKAAAQDWFMMVYDEFHYNTWADWKTAMIARFETREWRRALEQKLMRWRYPSSDPNSTTWITVLVRMIKSLYPTVDRDYVIRQVLSKIPEDLSLQLETRLQSHARPSLTLAIQEFESIARAHRLSGQSTARIDTRSAFPRTQLFTGAPAPVRVPQPQRPSAFNERREAAATSDPRPAPNGPRPLDTRPPITCYRCGKVGHIAPKCPNPPAVRAIAAGITEGHHSTDGEDESPTDEEQDSPEKPDPEWADTWDASSYDWAQKGQAADEEPVIRGLSFDVPEVLNVQAPFASVQELPSNAATDGDSDFPSELLQASGKVPVRVSTARAASIAALAPPTSVAPVLNRAAELGAHLFGQAPDVVVLINGKPHHLTLDSGADASVIFHSLLEEIDPDYTFSPSPLTRCLAYGGTPLKIMGTWTAEIVFPHPNGSLSIKVDFLVVEDPSHASGTATLLLGSDWMVIYGIDIIASSGRFLRIGKHRQRFALQAVRSTPRVVSAPVIAAATPNDPAFEDAISQAKINPGLADTEQLQLKNMLSTHALAFAHGTHQIGTYSMV